MAKVRNISGEDRTALGRLVLDGGVLEVPAADVYGFTQQVGIWGTVDADAQAAHDAAHAAYLDALAADGQRVPTTPAAKRGKKQEG